MALPGRGLLGPEAGVWVALALAGAVLGASCGDGTGSASTTAGVGTTTSMVSTTLAVTTTAQPSTTSTTTGTTTSSTTTTSTTVPTTTTTTQPDWWRPITPEDPLRVWVVGDSLAGPLGSALAGRGQATGLVVVTVDFESGTGLVRDDFYDWPGYAAQRLPEVAPDVVVSLLGANDGQALRPPAAWLEFGTPEWDREYAGRVGAFMDLLTDGSARVYWVGVPVMADPEYDARVQHINSVHQQQAAARGQLLYVDGYALFLNEAGEYAAQLTDEDGDLVTMRQADGIHLTTAGADRLALAVLRSVAADWGPAVLAEG